jgi:predicted lipoprotein with Yx(FWY)xxD motif
MTRRPRSIPFLAGAAVALIAFAATGCGSDNDSSATVEPTRTAATSGATAANAAVVGAAAVGGLGTILVDSQGRTLYLFKKDSGKHSACSGACAASWPPLLATGKPTVGAGASASIVGTARRSDGKLQVTYGGHPLYLFTGDKQPGDANGQGVSAFGAAWFALSTKGSQVSGTASQSGGGNAGY